MLTNLVPQHTFKALWIIQSYQGGVVGVEVSRVQRMTSSMWDIMFYVLGGEFVRNVPIVLHF